MLQALLPLMPGDAGFVAMAMDLAGMFIGAVLWLTGARFSRSLVTLSAVSMGAIIGMQLPEWMGWDVSGMGPAVGGAMVFGLSGFLLHRMWIGLALGTVLSMWALLILWAVTAQGQTWERPPVDESTTIATYAPELWQALPMDFTRLAG